MIAMERPAGRRWMHSATTFSPSADGTPERRRIPVPRVPLQPVVSLATFLGGGAETAPSIMDAGPATFVTAGRIAIARALALMGLSPGDKVLIPAYHCPAMVAPLSWVSAEPVFYRLNEDLSVDFDDVARKLDARTRVFMAVHFFGFPQDLAAIGSFAEAHRLRLIEDCSHSFFGSQGGRPLGSAGDIAIGSLTKFFPVRDGGCLVSARGELDRPTGALRSQGALTNTFTTVDSVEDSLAYGRMWALGPAEWAVRQAKRAVRAAIGSGPIKPVNPAQVRGALDAEFDPSWIDVRISAPSLAIARHAARRRIVSRRRRHYRRLTEAFAGVRGTRCVKPELPDGVVPYMFPLWIDELERCFPALEDHAVPMNRFGQFLAPWVDDTVCPVSMSYARHVVQLPCHQELTDSELEQVIELVQTVLAR